MNPKENSEKGYSNLQYILWLIAGSEISSLRNCPNDYNRHANIGLMILITSLFAGMMGFIAGSTFVTDNTFAVCVFAFVWAFLIFSLDRSMVNSIKKDPTVPLEDFAKYFAPRFILAVILSFFMSIPLDHIVFHEKIELEMDKNKSKDWLKRQEDLNIGYDIGLDTLKESRLDNKLQNINQLLNTGCSACPNEEYKSLMTEYERLNNELPSLSKAMSNDANAFNKYYGVWKNKQVNIPVEDQKWDSQLNTLNNKKRASSSKFYSKRSEVNGIAQKSNTLCNQWKQGLIVDKAKADSSLLETRMQIEASRDSIKIQSGEFKEKIEKMNGFDTQFTTLFLMPDWGVQILKWLIFLALLVIEILPTYLKLKTPAGQYDWEIYKKDKFTEIETLEKVNIFKTETAAIENYRSSKELELNKKIIDAIALKEEKLANEQLDDWENKFRSKFNN
jgi:hypothetical protein